MSRSVSLFIAAVVAAMAFACATVGASASILVGQCLEYDTCWTGSSPTPFDTTLNSTDLINLGVGIDGSYIALYVGQTSASVIQLGSLQAAILPGGTTDTLLDFTGPNIYSDPCPGFCEVDFLGYFYIPGGTTSADISGTFGNSVVPNSSAACVWVGDANAPAACNVTKAPEPLTLSIFGAGLAGALAIRRRKRVA